MKWLGLLVMGVVCGVGTGCAKRAPTSYELDKRSGGGIPPADPEYEHPKRYARRRARSFEEPLRSTSAVTPASRMPPRTAPVVRQVWVADQNLPDGSWLQGTWWFVEVSPSQWLHEVDPGAALFMEPVPERLPTLGGR